MNFDTRRDVALHGLARSLNRNASPQNVAHLQRSRAAMGLPPIPGAVGNPKVPFRAEPLNPKAAAAARSRLVALQAAAGIAAARLAAKAATVRAATVKDIARRHLRSGRLRNRPAAR